MGLAGLCLSTRVTSDTITALPIMLIAKLSSTLTVLDERPFASPVPAMARPDDDPNVA